MLCYILIFSLIFVRVLYVFTQLGKKKKYETKKLKLMAIAGSGGHTTELIRLLEGLPSNFSPRHYIIAKTDHISEKKLVEFEKKNESIVGEDYNIFRIPRSREVAQSWLTTIYTTFIASLYAFPITWKSKPDVILCNGPGTCIPLCAVGFLFKVLAISWTDIIFVESLCRVTTISMSGWMLYPFADQFFIQWPHLLNRYPKAIYLNGRVV